MWVFECDWAVWQVEGCECSLSQPSPDYSAPFIKVSPSWQPLINILPQTHTHTWHRVRTRMHIHTTLPSPLDNCHPSPSLHSTPNAAPNSSNSNTSSNSFANCSVSHQFCSRLVRCQQEQEDLTAFNEHNVHNQWRKLLHHFPLCLLSHSMAHFASLQ